MNILIKNKFLICMIAIFFIQGILYATYVVPPDLQHSPDEVGHFSYIQYLGKEKQLPILDETPIYESSFSLFITSEKYSSQATPDKYKNFNDNVYGQEFSNHNNYIIQHPPFYYLYMLPAYLFISLITYILPYQIIFLRYFSVLLGIIFIIYNYKLCKLISLNEIFTKCLLIILALNPQLQYYFSVINNDSMLMLLSLITLYYLLKYSKNYNKKDYYFFVIGCNLMVLTKYTAGLILIPYAIYFLIKIYQKYSTKENIILLVKGIGLSCLLVGPWLIRDMYLYGMPMPTSGYATTSLVEYTSTWKEFFIQGDYLSKIYNVIIYYTMPMPAITVNSFKHRILVISFVSLLMLSSYICYTYKNFKGEILNYISIFINISIFLFFIIVLQETILTSIFYSSFLALTLEFSIQYFNKNKEQDYNLFFALSIIFFFIFFMFKHFQGYDSSTNPKLIRAIHGRYYLPIVFQFNYLLLLGINKFWETKKYYNYLPLILFCIMSTYEIMTIKLLLTSW